MNIKKLMAVLAFALSASGAARADEPSAAEAPVSRAEVLAELQIWRAAGMTGLDDSEVGLAYTPAYDAAQARYEALHAAPSFAALVMRIAQRLGEKVSVASAR